MADTHVSGIIFAVGHQIGAFDAQWSEATEQRIQASVLFLAVWTSNWANWIWIFVNLDRFLSVTELNSNPQPLDNEPAILTQ